MKGLSKFDPKAETFRNYDRFDGFQGDQFTTLLRAKAPDGPPFFGGINGLSAFYPERLVEVCNDQGVTLHLRMLPAWWNTTWFPAFFAPILVSLLWAAYQFRVATEEPHTKAGGGLHAGNGEARGRTCG
ncbi:MAG: hypothetical protein JOY54_16170 [Acidobacteriaceae bacterium]|nr:hypothetical protein [Acidobacteriaceae bacterium]